MWKAFISTAGTNAAYHAEAQSHDDSVLMTSGCLPTFLLLASMAEKQAYLSLQQLATLARLGLTCCSLLS